MAIVYCLRFETPPTWRTRSPYLYPPGTGCRGFTPKQWICTLISDCSSASVPGIQPRGGPHRKHRFRSSSILACFFTNNPSTVASASVAEEPCLQSRYFNNGQLYLFHYPSFQQTCHDIICICCTVSDIYKS
jgi:hypothetical protein